MLGRVGTVLEMINSRMTDLLMFLCCSQRMDVIDVTELGRV
jgi:hypothetical protein